MKRKRFLKLAMSYGVQRNEAERLAAAVIVYGSYEALFKACRLTFEIERAKTAFRWFANTIVRVVRPALENLAAAFNGTDWPRLIAAEASGGIETAEME